LRPAFNIINASSTLRNQPSLSSLEEEDKQNFNASSSSNPRQLTSSKTAFAYFPNAAATFNASFTSNKLHSFPSTPLSSALPSNKRKIMFSGNRAPSFRRKVPPRSRGRRRLFLPLLPLTLPEFQALKVVVQQISQTTTSNKLPSIG